MSTLLSQLELKRAEDPTASDEVCVRAIARDVIRNLGITQPPVDVEMVASYLDVMKVVGDPALDVAGCLLCGDSGVEIRVCRRDPLTRQRFTICHECVHTFFPGFSLTARYRCSPEGRGRGDGNVEGLCDIGASELLLPEQLFRPAVRESDFSLSSLEGLADVFEASLLATGFRFTAVWPEDAALLVFEERQKPREAGTNADPALRLQMAGSSGAWPYFRKHKSVDPGDPFDRAGQGEVVHEECVTVRGVCDPVDVEVIARPYPYGANGIYRSRVIALLRRPGVKWS